MGRSVRLTSALLALLFAGACTGGTSTPAPGGSVGASVSSAPTPEPTATTEPSATSTATPTLYPTATPTPTPTATPTPTHTPTPAPTTPHGVFLATGSMTTPRAFETVTKLQNGKVLIVGGLSSDAIDSTTVLATAELYDPATGKSKATGSLHVARYGHFAALLNDGRVLIVGGDDASGYALTSAELYNPVTGTFSTTGNAPWTDYEPCNATTLKDGRVLFAGGWSIGSFSMNRAVIYDPAAGTFATTGSMVKTQCTSTTVLLPSGKVLIVGGVAPTGSGDKATALAQLFNPATGTFSLTGPLTVARNTPTATLISSTKVMVTGGESATSVSLATAEMYNISTGTSVATGSMSSKRAWHTATLLASGKVLVTGGVVDIPVNPCPADKPAELYDPTTGHFSATGRTVLCRSMHASVLLSSGRVLLVGGGPMVGHDQDKTMELYWP